MVNRSCGGCTLCCYFLLVREYESARYEYCLHCRPANGCSIYDARADVCRAFKCVWLEQEQIPNHLRPDKCGVMLEAPAGCNTYICYVDPARPGADLAPGIIQLIRKCTEASHPVIVYRGREYKKIFYLPRGYTIEAVNADIAKSMELHSQAGRI